MLAGRATLRAGAVWRLGQRVSHPVQGHELQCQQAAQVEVGQLRASHGAGTVSERRLGCAVELGDQPKLGSPHPRERECEWLQPAGRASCVTCAGKHGPAERACGAQGLLPSFSS
jgi:hypothetical protein